MHIVINCLGMPFNHDIVENESLGGSETACHHIGNELAKSGYTVEIFTKAEQETRVDYETGSIQYRYAGRETEECPMGELFDFFASNTPHDILIIQRHPLAFHKKYQSKANFLWMHDLALHRNKNAISDSLWNINGILCVSEYHRSQIAEVYSLPKDRIHVIRNGVDLSFIDDVPVSPTLERDHHKLIYISRPERGLDHLVEPGGIMDQLDDTCHLYVCCYNNVTESMLPYYSQLWRLIEAHPRIHNLGFLNKQDLYAHMKSSDLMVYPTPGKIDPEFREVSCIAAMESQACHLPMITTLEGALPETNRDAGVMWATIEGFAEAIKTVLADDSLMESMSLKQGQSAVGKDWSGSACDLMCIIDEAMARPPLDQKHKFAVRYGAISDAVTAPASPKVLDMMVELGGWAGYIGENYRFLKSEDFSEHYKELYDYEKTKGTEFGPEVLTDSRSMVVREVVRSAVDGGAKYILDYGCAHGHYTMDLSSTFPLCRLTGIDLVESNIQAARRWAVSTGSSNVAFYHVDEESPSRKYDVVLLGEILEHVANPQEFIRGIMDKYAHENTLIIVTTPYGPWEYQSLDDTPYRMHIHHFSQRKLKGMFGHLPDFNMLFASQGHTAEGELLGSWITQFRPGDVGSLIEDPAEAIACPQTLTLCMIVRDSSSSLLACLNSVSGVVDELVLGVDNLSATIDQELAIAESWCEKNHVGFKPIKIVSPINTGFDTARNLTLERATGDWIIWLDADEVVINKHNISKYLKENMVDSYAVRQEHFSCDPVGVIRTDYPAKIFRNQNGFHFYGRVHEHPEVNGLNGGAGVSVRPSDFHIVHSGYTDEPTRRKRFERNLSLMQWDRETWPDRKLGHLLFLRDMAHICNFESDSGRPRSEMALKAAEKGMECWQQVTKHCNTRMIIEGLGYYSTLVKTTTKDWYDIDMSCGIGTHMMSNKVAFKGTFISRSDALDFCHDMLSRGLFDIPTKYV